MGKNEESKPLRPKEYYRERIIEYTEKIESEKILKLIYGFARSGYNEERAGK